MKREITGKLVEWKHSKRRKPLLITGVRQCGKTFTIKDFGAGYYQNMVYLNFEENENLSAFFENDYEIPRIIREIEINQGTAITPGETLLVFDEIQECPKAITALKYFCENGPEYHVVGAGSLLGVALKRENISFPVGKVNRMQMYPMSFREFVTASGMEEQMEFLADWPADRPVPELYAAPMRKLLKEYYVIGGMPEVVREWSESHDIKAVEEIQDEIISGYADDFAKHAPATQIEKIRWIWNSVPKQLAKENNKFIFSHVKAGKRAAELEEALQWLKDAGLVTQLELVEKPEIPLSGASDATYFKVYMSDVGLLCRRSGLSSETVWKGDELFLRYKGALAENFVLNELICQGNTAHFWRSGNTAEVDILTEDRGRLVPMEVKAAENTRAKSYQLFCKRYTPSIGYKISMRNIGENMVEGTRTISLPLWLMWNWRSYLDA